MLTSVLRRTLVLAALAGAAQASAQTFTWTNGSGSGFWNGTANWSPAGFPNSSTSTAIINQPGTYAVVVPVSIDVGTVTITNPNATLAIDPAGNLTIYSTTYASDGPILINRTAGASQAYLRLYSGGTLGGSGDVTLNANPASLTSALLLAFNGTLTIPPTRTVRGCGTLDGRVNNDGVISADQPGRILDMNPVGNFSNTNLVQAVNGGILRLNGFYNTQTAGAKLSANGGTLILDSLNLTGGTIERINGGTLTLTGSHDWDGVTLAASDLAINSGVNITTYDAGGWTFNGPITINPTGGASQAYLRLYSGGTLGGSGDVTLNANPAVLTSALLLAFNGTLTIPPSRTVRGSGTLDGTVVNNGVISADQPGRILDMNPVGNFSNTNLVQAVNGGILRLNGFYNTQTAGAKLSANGGTLILDSLDLTGGTIERINGGTLTLTGSHDWNGVTLAASDLAINSGVNITTYDTGGWTFNGPITINPSGGASQAYLRLYSGGTLGGSGDVTLNANPASLTSALLLAFNGTLTIPPSRTVRGSGTLDGRVNNDGIISADQPGRILDMNPVGNFSNTNLVQAVNGGILRLNGFYNTQTAGAKLSANGGTLILDNLNLVGGTIERINGGTLTLTGSHDWDGVTLNASDLSINPGVNITTYDTGGWTFNGPITINPSGGASQAYLRLYSGGTLGGSGDVTLNANPASLTSALLLAFNGTLTIPPGRTVRGTGTIDNTFRLEGTLSPGALASRGVFNITGNTTFASTAAIDIEIGGTAPAQFDRLIGTGSRTLGGTLNITLVDGHVPGFDTRYDIITAGSVTGRFSQTNLPAIPGAPPGRRLVVSYLTNGVRVHTCPPNCDGSSTAPTLNALDFACFLQRYREDLALAPTQQTSAYANCDGSTTAPVLNALDFACFLQQFRAGCP